MSDCQDFLQFGLDPRLLQAIQEMGYEKPTPIQCKAIPLVLEGKDMLAAAQTGTGKTAGFGLPALQNILKDANTSMSPARHPVRILVLSPTRELADQTAEALSNFAAKTPLRVGVVYGGVDIKPQIEQVRKGVEVLIATPGRLLDHLEQKSTNLNQVSIVVLDEADRMLDMGFLPDISRILNKLPKKRQNLLFSVTFSLEIKKLAGNFLVDPVLVTVAQRNTTASTITQEVYKVQETQKRDALIDLLESRALDANGNPLQTIVFVNSKLTARRLSKNLQDYGLNADAIHGDKTQDERLKILGDFKSGALNILVATDVAARGLDIAELPLVINFDVPFISEDYVHRIGRTGRAGQKGLAQMLVTPADSRSFEAIERMLKKKFDVKSLTPEAHRIKRRTTRSYSYEKPEEHLDAFFTQPYVPSDAKESKAAQAPRLQRSEKNGRPRAVLLGGSGRK